MGRMVADDPMAHRFEHSIEVQLPFIQYLREDVTFVPIAMAAQDYETAVEVADEVRKACQGRDVVIIASTDFSHYVPPQVAARQDRAVIDRILALDAEGIYDTVVRKNVSMCGYGPVMAMLLASVLIQAATNMFNEYFDYMSGLDTAESVGIAGAITKDNVPPRAILLTAIGTLGVAVLLGVYICAQSSWWLACIGVVCMLVGYLYAGGPYPISATPFGELFAGLFMGTGITLIACFIQRRTICVRDVLVSIPSALLIGAILTSNNIRDLEQDCENGRRTLAILLGHNRAVRFLACTLLLANLWVVFLVARGVASSWLLLVLGSLGLAAQAIRQFQGEATVPGMMLGMKRVAQTNTLFGLLLVLGLILGR
jgi:1,4-dihydroxy-2-naphthoate octaprenyltransferase